MIQNPNRFLLLIVALLQMVVIPISAEQITKQEALQKAQQFMPNKQFGETKSFARSENPSETEPYYIFNAENKGGFVIVSGDDRAPAILGYSDSGEFQAENMPDNVRYWLEGYAAQIRSISDGESRAKTRGTRTELASIEPLIKTQWDQGDPYNRMCPYDGNNRCPTGCVATAVAQILYYHKWPENVASLSGYTYTKVSPVPVSELPETTFNYDLMQASYPLNMTEPDPSGDAVAELMRYCGQAFKMDYQYDGSGALLLPITLATYFQYSSFHGVNRVDYTDDLWEQMMYEELQNARPVLYDGYPEEGEGHQFILDGYKDGLFHINWGWGGRSNGYFILSLANPDQPEHTATSGRFYNRQSAILGVTSGRYENKVIVGSLWYVCDTNAMTAKVIVGNYDGMEEVIIPATIKVGDKSYTVTGIDEKAFSGLRDLKKIELPSTLTMIGDKAFANCENISTVICHVEDPLAINENVFSFTKYVKNETTGDWDSSVEFLEATLWVPDGAASKYMNATVWKKFHPIYEGELKKITVDGLNYSYVTGSKVATVLGGDDSAMESVTIPSSITVAGVEYKVNMIGNGAFFNNHSLKSLTLPEGLETIGKHAFFGCKSLKRLDLPSSLTTIKDKAFYNLMSLKEVLVNFTEPLAINENVFSYSDWDISDGIYIPSDSIMMFTNATLYVPEGTSSKFKKAAVWNKFPVIYEGEPLEATINGINYFCVTGPKTATVKSGDPEMEDVTIPSTITVNGVTYKVKAIGNNAFATFSGTREIKSLTISEGIESIGDKAFYWCSGFEHLVIPEGVKTIGSDAFSDCFSVKRLDLPSSLTSIGENAFYDMRNLTAINIAVSEPLAINENVFSIKDTFSEATLYVPEGTSSKYKNADVWNKFQTIKEGTLKDIVVNGLHYMFETVPKTATVTAGDYSTMESITIPSTITVDNVKYAVKAIDDKAFYNCSAQSLVLPEGLEIIGNDAFCYCSGIDHLVIPEGVETIGSGAFNTCRLVKQLELPSSLTAIGENAFYGMNDLTAIIIAASEPFSINENVFSYKTSVKNEETGTLEYVDVFSKATLYVPEGASSKYKEVAVWNKFNPIYEGEPIEATVDGLNYSCATGSKVATVIAGDYSTMESVIIPSTITVNSDKYNVKAIDASVFYNCSSIKSLTLPDGLEAIGNNAFWGCSMIENLVIPEGVKTIGSSAFSSCYRVKRLDLPSSLTTIGDYAFYGMEVLRTIKIAVAKPLTINENVFSYSNATLYVPEGASSNYKKAAVWKKFQPIYEGDLKEVTVDGLNYLCATGSKVATVVAGDYSTLESITIPSTITADGVKYNVKAIDDRAFVNGFMDYHSIKSLTLSEGLETIGNDAFRDYYGFDHLVIPEGVKTIGSNAFNNCITVKQLELPSSLTSIGDKAFYGMQALTTIKVAVSEPLTINENVFTYINGFWNDETEEFVENEEFSKATLYVPEDCKAAYQTADQWNKFANILEIGDVAKVSVKISDSGKTTLTSSEALDFSGFDALKAYVATGYEGNGTIWLTRIKQVPANTPILVKGEASTTYDIPVMDYCDAYYENLFQGNAEEDTYINPSSSEDGVLYNYFYMAGGQFKPASDKGQTIKAGKCYLQVPATFNAAKTGENQTVKIADSGKSSYAPPVDIDLTEVEGLKAYAATGYDAASQTIWLTRINKIQAGEGVMLKGEGGKTYTLPSVAAQAYYGNMIIGNIDDPITINEISDDGEWANFYLAKGKFNKVSGSREIGTNKSYLHLPTSLLVSSSSARGKQNAGIEEWLMEELETEVMYLGSIGGDDDGTTKIDAIRQDNVQPDVYYNLQGQRVNNPRKGIYIRNGKKVVIRSTTK